MVLEKDVLMSVIDNFLKFMLAKFLVIKNGDPLIEENSITDIEQFKICLFSNVNQNVKSMQKNMVLLCKTILEQFVCLDILVPQKRIDNRLAEKIYLQFKTNKTSCNSTTETETYLHLDNSLTLSKQSKNLTVKQLEDISTKHLQNVYGDPCVSSCSLHCKEFTYNFRFATKYKIYIFCIFSSNSEGNSWSVKYTSDETIFCSFIKCLKESLQTQCC